LSDIRRDWLPMTVARNSVRSELEACIKERDDVFGWDFGSNVVDRSKQEAASGGENRNLLRCNAADFLRRS
jgi:hypothetical protein